MCRQRAVPRALPRFYNLHNMYHNNNLYVDSALCQRRCRVFERPDRAARGLLGMGDAHTTGGL